MATANETYDHSEIQLEFEDLQNVLMVQTPADNERVMIMRYHVTNDNKAHWHTLSTSKS
jgi:hypothetical protein